MYIESDDYQTIWNLAHNWARCEPSSTDPNNLSKELKLHVHRLAAAIFRGHLPARNKKRRILMDDSLLVTLLDYKHYRQLKNCIQEDHFDKSYLNSIYVGRAQVIDWCTKQYLDIPPIWHSKTTNGNLEQISYDSSDDENEGWYTDLTERRKQRVACLEMAKKLWLINPNQSYEEIYTHPTMKQFGNPNVFSLETFKKWTRPFSPAFAKEGGRPKQIK